MSIRSLPVAALIVAADDAGYYCVVMMSASSDSGLSEDGERDTDNALSWWWGQTTFDGDEDGVG